MVDRRQCLKLCAAGASAVVAGCSSMPRLGVLRSDGSDSEEKIDDWQYEPSGDDDGGSAVWQVEGVADSNEAMDSAASPTADDSIGLAAGGAADIGTFRRNVKEGYLPIPESMAYEGLFHDYYFDTGGDGSCSSLFCPTYTPAITPDPLSGETERYLSVGLDSGLSQSAFDRPPLNLVVVLDISGSMRSSFDNYYYDKFGNKKYPEGDTNQPKIEVAKDVLADLTEHLRPDDRLGVVLFSSDSSVAKPMRKVSQTDMEAIRGHIQEDIQAGGGTNISAGMDDAEDLLETVIEEDDEDYEHRSILLTDAQINLGETDADELRSNLESRAQRGMHASVIGIGVDFNADLINQITAVRGANYYSVYSADQFEQRLIDEFEYMVSPLVFDLSLELDADGYDISQVYGSPAADEATGELMSVNTLFPSPASDGKAKGGVVLVEVEPTGRAVDSSRLELKASWERRSGRTESTVETISFPNGVEHWGSDAVRKAVLLTRYANLMKHWTVDERRNRRLETDDGIEPPERGRGQWELQSDRLTVSPHNADRFREFRTHFERESQAIGDENLAQELELIDEILAAAEPRIEPDR